MAADDQSHPLPGQGHQRLLLGGDRTNSVHHRHLVIELRVPQGHRRLVGQDHQQATLVLGGEVGGAGLEDEDAEDAFLILEWQVEPARDRGRLQVGICGDHVPCSCGGTC